MHYLRKMEFGFAGEYILLKDADEGGVWFLKGLRLKKEVVHNDFDESGFSYELDHIAVVSIKNLMDGGYEEIQEAEFKEVFTEAVKSFTDVVNL